MKTAAIEKHLDHFQNRKSSSLFKSSHGGGIVFATPCSSTWIVLKCILFVTSCLIPSVSALVTWQGTVSCFIKGRQVSRFACFVCEIWVLRFRVLRASCFGLRKVDTDVQCISNYICWANRHNDWKYSCIYRLLERRFLKFSKVAKLQSDSVQTNKDSSAKMANFADICLVRESLWLHRTIQRSLRLCDFVSTLYFKSD